DYPELLRMYRETTEGVVARRGGAIFGSEGDGLFAAFAEAGEAVSSAIDCQDGFRSAAWPAGAQVRVRMGIHTGTPTLIGDDYTGIDVHRAARIMSAAWGGQVLVSEATRSLITDTGIKCRELGLYAMKGLSRNERLYQLEGAGLNGDFPPVRARRHEVDLPSPPTPLVGREEDIVTVERLLLDDMTRLVTLTGAGGIGKSRLALAVAAKVAAEFADGIGYVDVSNETMPERVFTSIAEALGVAGDPSHPALDALIDHLADLDLLLVLDGFERVSAAAVDLADLLTRCPDLRVLVTSRAPLRIGAEREIRVSPLEIPAAGSGFEAISASPAVRLFVERAMAVRPDFRLDASNAAVICDLVARLEGYPLSIELASARARLLPPEAILERLGDVLDLATTSPELPTRQQSLRATIEWSHGLLSEPDQALFRRLGVFVDGWSLEAAEAVAGGDEPDVVLGLETLAAQSMISVDPDGRMSMGTAMRDFASERLAVAGDEEETRLRHAEHFDSAAVAAEPLLRGPRQREIINALSKDWRNLRAAAEWALETDRIELAGSLYTSSWILAWQGDHWNDTDKYTSKFVGVIDRFDEQLQARILFVAAGFRMETGDGPTAIAYARPAIELANRVGDRETEAWAHLMLAGSLLYADASAPEPREHIDRAVALARSLDDPFVLGYSLSFQAAISTLDGDLATGLANHFEVLEIANRLEIVPLICQTYSQVAMTHLTAGDIGLARTALESAAEYVDRLRSMESLAVLLDGVSWLAFAEGDQVRAMTALGAANAARSRVGLVRWALIAELLDAAGFAAEAEHPGLADARHAGEEMSPQDAIAYALEPHHELAATG
ncbi:MAG TPA: AAA family ATPase, partial [Acidimicrobiia bacterium]|nr:AAA family ATPase [Acidimicrobiia bacterium]